jgi:arylsulfatase A-like enzyme
MTLRRKWMIFAGILIPAVLLLLFVRYLVFPRKAEGYNVVLVSIDTCRADFLSVYGNSAISTPHLDALAKKGIVLDHYYSVINTTLPSHASLFTGLYPRNHGVARNAMRLHSKNLTLAEYLKSQGYHTAAFVGSFALASIFGLNQGFDFYEESFIGDPSRFIGREIELKTKEGKTLEALEPDTKTGDITRRAEDVNHAFFQWLDHRPQGKFFAFVHYYDPHFPYYPPEAWYRKHLPTIPEGTPLTERDRTAYYPKFRSAIGMVENFRPGGLNSIEFPPVLQAMLLLYASEIEYTDHALGDLLQKLEEKGLAEHTVIIVTSDHGENLIEHQKFNSFFRHGTLTHETEIHVPFFISCPGVLPQNRRLENVYSELDVYPTILQLLNLKQPGAMDGSSFYPDLFRERKTKEPRLLFAEASQPRITGLGTQEVSWPNNSNSASLRYGEYKYMDVPWKKYEAVFHIPEDDLEEQNLLGALKLKSPERISRFRSLLKAWRSRVMFGNIDTTFQLSDEDREKLESLGYVQ